MQLYMSWYIRSFFGFTFLYILYFFKYYCTNIFHRRSLYTFYWSLHYFSTTQTTIWSAAKVSAACWWFTNTGYSRKQNWNALQNLCICWNNCWTIQNAVYWRVMFSRPLHDRATSDTPQTSPSVLFWQDGVFKCYVTIVFYVHLALFYFKNSITAIFQNQL